MATQELQGIYLTLWNLDVKDQPTISQVRAHLEANGLNPERAEDVPASTALRRAASELKTKESDVKVFTSKKTDRLRAQFDALIENEEGQIRRKFVALYELSENDRPEYVGGEVLSEIPAAFDKALTTYTGADLSRVIQNILKEDGLGSYSPRKGGGVYFVPVKPEAQDLLQRIERFAQAVQVRFLTYSIPDTQAQRAEIAEAIADAYANQVGEHGAAIAEYTPETREHIFANRREALQATRKALDSVALFLNGRYASLCQDLEDLNVKLTNAENARKAQQDYEANQNRAQGRRRIVAVTA